MKKTLKGYVMGFLSASLLVTSIGYAANTTTLYDAVVEGVKALNGANVKATDLRGGSAMLLAGLSAKGKTEISEIYHIDRGYEEPEKVLEYLGADIKRMKVNEETTTE